MIRLTLRQFRAEGIAAAAVLGVLAIVLIVTGLHLAHVDAAFQSACRIAGDCDSATDPVVAVYRPLQIALPFTVMVGPALVGLFFGAPLIARELETGTFRLAWTQTISRRRWLAVKLGMIGAAAMVVGGLLSWMVGLWAEPLDRIGQDRFDPTNFGYHGTVPIGYAAFGFALGAAAGTVLRRTVPAMAVALVGFIAARIVVMYWVRPFLATPRQSSLSLSDAAPSFSLSALIGGGPVDISLRPPEVNLPGAWVYGAQLVDAAGNRPDQQVIARACPALIQVAQSGHLTKDDFHACVDTLSATYHTVITYQPADRFWPFQWAETAIFLAAALALCGFTYWWIRRQYTV
jgi:hypothetical protein